MQSKMIHPDIERMIAEEVLVNNGLMGLNASDIQKLRDRSDYVDGIAVDGELAEIKKLIEIVSSKIKSAHSGHQLKMLIYKIRIAKGFSLPMEQMLSVGDLFSEMGDDVPILWGVETNASINGEVRVCVLGGFDGM